MEQAPQQEATAQAPIGKYPVGTRLKHLKSGDEYFIHVTPDNHVRVEATGDLAYGYAKADQHVGPDSPVWFRSQLEIEDPARYEVVPQAPDPRQDPAFLEAEKADFNRFHTELQEKLTELWAPIYADADTVTKEMFDAAKAALVEYLAGKYANTHEINVLDHWSVPHMGKGGIPVAIADHAAGYLHDISLMVDFKPVAPEGPQMLFVEEVTDHLIEGVENNLKISLMRPSNGQADRPDSHDVYLVKGFTTQGFGGKPQQTGLLVQFQDGPTKEVGNTGVSIESLLAIAKHRLEHFNQGAMECDQNTRAIWSIETALNALKERTLERLADGKLGTAQP